MSLFSILRRNDMSLLVCYFSDYWRSSALIQIGEHSFLCCELLVYGGNLLCGYLL